MNFTWHESKRKDNLKKHGFDFVDAEQVFDAPTFTVEDSRSCGGEQRLNLKTSVERVRRWFWRGVWLGATKQHGRSLQ